VPADVLRFGNTIQTPFFFASFMRFLEDTIAAPPVSLYNAKKRKALVRKQATYAVRG
jgi:hypothetical protein